MAKKKAQEDHLTAADRTSIEKVKQAQSHIEHAKALMAAAQSDVGEGPTAEWLGRWAESLDRLADVPSYFEAHLAEERRPKGLFVPIASGYGNGTHDCEVSHVTAKRVAFVGGDQYDRARGHVIGGYHSGVYSRPRITDEGLAAIEAGVKAGTVMEKK